MTYTTQAGRYNKIGKLVTLWLDIILSARGSSTGTVTITGVPFTAGSVGGSGTVGFASTISAGIRLLVSAGSTTISTYGGTGTPLDETAFTSDAARLIATITFEASA
jgi:hypothetical protein